MESIDAGTETNLEAWSVTFEDGRVGVCAAASMAEAASRVEAMGRVIRIEWVGGMLA